MSFTYPLAAEESELDVCSLELFQFIEYIRAPMRPELQIFAFPLSLILAAALFVAAYLCPKKCPRILSLVVLCLLAVGFAVLGCLKPEPGYRYWLAPILLVAIFLSALAARDGFRERRDPGFTLSHLGLSVLLASSFFGAPDSVSSAIILEQGRPSHLTEDSIPLPFELELKEVHTEFYEGRAVPKQYVATLALDSKTRRVSVNHPALHKGWLVYISDFDRESGRKAMLRLVRNPSIPGVLAGMILLLVASVLSLRRSWSSRYVLPAVIVLAVVFTLVSVSRIRFATLPPALRSFWFAPHLIVYMIAYATLALSLVCCILSFFPRFGKASALASNLLRTSSSLILMGIIFGSIWAQLSWGDYWAWDAKECWAAATYILTLCAIHLPAGSRRASLLAALLIAFASMQMTWYGVNYLPSAQNGPHVYNSK